MARPLRYNFIVGLVALSAALAAAGGWRYARASAPVSGPIILVSVNSLRADHLPVYGYTKARTPAIDRLAADGVVFERAYSHAPQTLPAHASILSGRLPFDTGVRDNVGFAVRDSDRLLAEILRDRGYATGAIVSTFELREASGIAQGFAFFDDTMAAASLDVALGDVERDGHESERIAERWLDSVGTERAFLFLQIQEPRALYTRIRTSSTPAELPEFSPYDAGVAAADDVVGHLVRYLKAHQLYDQSTILLLSDHGEGLGEHGEQAHGLFLYEEALHIPLIVKQAAGQGAGRRVKDLVQQVDLLPTILDLAKAPIPGNARGRSLKAILDGTGRLSGRSIYSESFFGQYHFGWAGLTAVTDGAYRYINAPREELYDLQQDPGEQRNLALDPAHAETLAALRDRLNQLDARVSLPAPNDVSQEDRERFAALGYVGETDGAPSAEPLDPKDGVGIVETYRTAVDLGVSRQWTQAIQTLQPILRHQPASADVWRQVGRLAARAGRLEQALDAYKHVAALEPDDLASQAVVHELAARIALARRDLVGARRQARLANERDPSRPIAAFIEGRVLFDRGRYVAALSQFERAAAGLAQTHGRPIADLHAYMAETLNRLGGSVDAEAEFLKELADFPENTRARAALAVLYQETGRTSEAAGAVADLDARRSNTGRLLAGFTSACEFRQPSAGGGHRHRSAASRQAQVGRGECFPSVRARSRPFWYRSRLTTEGPPTRAAQSIGSRVILATVTGTGTRPLVDLEADDFVVDEGGTAREILSLHVADYPIVVLLDDTAATRQDMVAMQEAAARFITRIGDRAVAAGTLANPPVMLASFDDARAVVLERIKQVSASPAASPMVFRAAASAAQMIRENGTPFSAIVILSARPVGAAQATDREFLMPVLESGATVYVIASRTPPSPETPPEQDDVLRGLAEQTAGQFTAIYSTVSYPSALDRLADRLATEMMIEYLLPVGAVPGDVRIGVRIPGARATGLGVSK